MDENGDYRFAIGSEECEMTGALDNGAQDIVFPKYGYDHAGLTGRQWVETELDLFGEAFAKVESAEQLEKEISDNRK